MKREAISAVGVGLGGVEWSDAAVAGADSAAWRRRNSEGGAIHKKLTTNRRKHRAQTAPRNGLVAERRSTRFGENGIESVGVSMVIIHRARMPDGRRRFEDFPRSGSWGTRRPQMDADSSCTGSTRALACSRRRPRRRVLRSHQRRSVAVGSGWWIAARRAIQTGVWIFRAELGASDGVDRGVSGIQRPLTPFPPEER